MTKCGFVGIDVAKESLTARVRRPAGGEETREFPNTSRGHKNLINWAKRGASSVRVAVESTGTYSLDLAAAIKHTRDCDVMIVAPKRARDFARSLNRRDKDDRVDAWVLLEFAQRMPFEPWTEPDLACRQLRTIMRQVRALLKAQVSLQNQLAAVSATRLTPASVVRSAERAIRDLKRETEGLYKAAQQLVQGEPELAQKLRLLQTIKGIALKSALQLLGELCVLPPGLSAREWVSHAGLCPRRHRSGTSINTPARIGKAGNHFIRAALFMPAMTAKRTDPLVKAFAERLLTKGAKKIQVIVAVMRKLLHAAHAVLSTNQPYNSALLFARAC
jgi:transposase